MRLCLRRRFPSLGLHRGILNSSSVLIFLIHTKHKYMKMKSWTNPTSSFPWRRTHPLGRQKTVVKYCIPTLIPCICHIPSIPTLIPCIPHIPSIPTPIPRILTLIPRVPIIVLIPFPDSSVRLLQIVNYSILFRWTYGYPSMLDKGFFLFGLDQAPTLSEFIIDTQEGNFRVI